MLPRTLKVSSVATAIGAALVLLVISLAVIMMDQDPLKHIKQEAQKCADYSVSGNVEGQLSYTHPRVIAQAGGRETTLAHFKRAHLAVASRQPRLIDVIIEQPLPLQKIGPFLISVVPYMLVFEGAGQGVDDEKTSEKYYLALSEDSGKNWYFLDVASKETLASIYDMFPELNGKLELPPAPPPEQPNTA